MPEQSSMHVYLNWTKQRIDEMDAMLASLEAKAGQAKADQLIAEMKKQRDDFQSKAKVQAQAGEAALQASKEQLEAQWQGFETKVKAYFDTISKQVEQQQATFGDAVAAQLKAWRAAADAFSSEAAKIAAAKRADVDAAVKQMKADATEAEARFEKLKQVGSETWSSLSAALTESRKAFDRANQKAGDALNEAATGKTGAAS
ncbi:hypothetical protein I6F35_04065 [Bradyrhizobium sp. BRP22]|uniref:hypothetical protein n=1 Tax=Bradyrhizobium sp. BRP22 TaxID=2793821 RepID=UPI001CD39B1A|nr:hypothetical protein [Bradyrhizobium sp. BRP22]MCA1452394.1 hypothetical protein [Bradyrhizobium sp. BRP22]